MAINDPQARAREVADLLATHLSGYGDQAGLDSLVFVAMVKYDPDRPPHVVIQATNEKFPDEEPHMSYLAEVLRATADTFEDRVDDDDLPSLD